MSTDHLDTHNPHRRNEEARPLPRRAAGVALPLFSLRGGHDMGTGEILDLIPFIDWLAQWHQHVVQLLPINETAPAEASPYTALSAFAIDPAYISASRVVDVMRSQAAQRWLHKPQLRQKVAHAAQALQRDRRAAYALKLRLLEFGFAEFDAHAGDDTRRARFERFCEHNAWWLDDYALFRALKERRRWSTWESWSSELRARDPEALGRAAVSLQTRTRFAQYLQWIAAEQWAEVRIHARTRGVLLKGDLPFVCGRDSADVWAHPELFDFSSSAGAPPDAFSATGQAWGLPLYNWDAMRASDYSWWRQRARQAAQLYDMFRVDHVIGLYRTYAMPVEDGGTAGFVPREEGDQLQQGREVLGAILEEAGRTTVVIAEDLGTVPDWARALLTELGIPGYKVFRWERYDGRYLDPRTYSALSVATSGTHDTDTLSEWWEGLEHTERRAVVDGFALDDLAQLDAGLSWTVNLHLALLQRLYESGSRLTILPIQDVFGWRERINVPATIDTQNWAYRLPVTIEALADVPAIYERTQKLRALADATGRGLCESS